MASNIDRASLVACLLTACGGSHAPPVAEPVALAMTTEFVPPPWTNEPAAAPQEPEVTGAARNILDTALRMHDEGEVVRGSCYRFVDAVFDEAGYDGWRDRTHVFRGRRSGPFADLELIEPGDWLWIINCAECDPVATHSVLFISWQDRANGIANVWSYVGRSEDRTADYATYDVSRTYSITRALDPAPSGAE